MAPAGKKPTEEDVIAYLTQNKDFFVTHASLLEKMELPNLDGQNVTGFADFQVKKLKQKLESLEQRNKMLLQTATDNLSSEQMIHDIAVALLMLTTRDDIEEFLADILSEELDVDGVRILYTKGASPKQSIKEDDMFVLFDEESDVVLRTLYTDEDRALHGNKAKNMASDALIRLNFEEKDYGLLALGSYDPTRFHPGQGSDLLSFLGQVLGYCLSREQLEKKTSTKKSTSVKKNAS